MDVMNGKNRREFVLVGELERETQVHNVAVYTMLSTDPSALCSSL